MYKLLTVITIMVLIIGCGSQKKETPSKVAAQSQEFSAVIKTIEPMTVASIEHMGSYREFGKTMSELFNCTMQRQIKSVGAPIGIYYDDPSQIKPESTRYEVCIPVSPETKGDKLVTVKTLAGGEVASTIYIGAYDKVASTYQKLMKWIEGQGYVVSGPAREIYLNDPSAVPAESLKIEIQFPVTKKAE